MVITFGLPVYQVPMVFRMEHPGGFMFRFPVRFYGG